MISVRQALTLCEAGQGIRSRTNPIAARTALRAARLPPLLAAAAPQPAPPDSRAGGHAMTRPYGTGRVSGKERNARAAIGMPARHPEHLTRKPGRAEWRQLAAWLAELWPHDEYTAIVTDTWRQDHP